MDTNGTQTPPGLSRRTVERIRRAYPTAMQRLVVTEFPDEAGNPLEIFYWPKTGADEQRIDAWEPKDQPERLVYTLIAKAMDDQGKPLFDWSEARTLLRYMGYEVLSRIFLVLAGIRAGGTQPTHEELKREIEADPTLPSDSSLAPNSTNP